ncbi:thioredoxin domain-containing protein 6-like [Leucoraja erinacea]|uniref:thioredoxin domain-containing protein 6-like n=1 Tax=Leucoraja erinaceus TaxID=7782 RepID=UPI002455B45C|nr:thioredoxin domain-containing protein 6-like [Leucoraja erinacea]
MFYILQILNNFISPYQTPLHSETEWDEMFEAKGLSVVDVHQQWCGPCKAILSVFRRLKMEYGDELLHFHTVQANIIPLLQGFEGKCEPAFLFIAAGQIVDYVKGVNAPVINNKIIALMETETDFYEKGVERQEETNPLPVVFLVQVKFDPFQNKAIQAIQLYDVEDEIEEFLQVATSKHVDKIFAVVIIKPNAVITGNDNNIKEQISEAGLQIMAEETAQLTEEEAKELYEHKKHQRNYEEIVQTMSSGVCDVLLLSDEMKDFVFDMDEAEITKTNDDDSDIRDLAHRLFSFFFPIIYEKYKKIERTLAIISPQLLELQRDEILEEITNARFTIGRQKEINLIERQVTAFYNFSEKSDLSPEFMDYMTSGPILALALLRDNAIQHWQRLLGPDDIELAKEEYPSSLRAKFALEDIPFPQLHGSQDIEIAAKELQFFFPVEHTLVAIKPDTVRQHKDIIITRIQEGSFTISAIKSVKMSKEMAAEFYQEHEEEPFFNQLIESVSQGPSMIIILTKENAVREWTELMGPVELELAKLAFPNSLRAQLDSTILKNQLHSSSSAKHAKDHIKLLFGDTLRDTFVLDEEPTISSTALLSIPPSAEPSITAIESTELLETEAPTDEQEIIDTDGMVAPETQAISIPGEVADSDTIDASAPVEESGTSDINGPGEVSVIDTSDTPALAEMADVGDIDVVSAEVPDAGTEDKSAPVEVLDAQDLVVPDKTPDINVQSNEALESTAQDALVPNEVPDASTLDVSTPGEPPDSTTQDISVPSEIPKISVGDASLPGEDPDSDIQNVAISDEASNVASSEVPDSKIQDVSTLGEVPDISDPTNKSRSQDISAHVEAPDASTEDMSTDDISALDENAEDLSTSVVATDDDIGNAPVAVEAADAEVESSSVPIEIPDVDVEAPAADVESSSAPIEIPAADVESSSAPIEIPAADAESSSAPIEIPAADAESSSAPIEIPDADVEAPDAEEESSSAPIEIPDADVEAPAADVESSSAPIEAPDVDVESPSAPIEVPAADVESSSAPIEIPDAAGNEDISAPIDTADVSNEDVPAPSEVPAADNGGTSAPIETPDAGTEDIPDPSKDTNTGNEDASVL